MTARVRLVPSDPGEREWVRRCELRLELAPIEPLRVLPLDPDPLSAFACQFESFRGDRGERADVVVDMLAVM